MKQKLLSFLTLLTFAIGQLYAYDFSAANSDGVVIYYNIIDNGVEVTSNQSTYRDNVVIPGTVSYGNTEYAVTAIGNSAFAYCSGLTSVSIPNSITAIGYAGFAGCSGLTSVSIPNSVTAIGREAFYDCSNLVSFYGKYSSDDNRCLIIDGNLIAFAPAGVRDYTIPNSVTSIGDYAFAWCSRLTSVSIPNSVTAIGREAFYNCSGLASVSIPNSVTAIGREAFARCSNLAAFYGKYSSDDNRCLIIDGDLIAFAPADVTDYTIPNSVTAIGDRAFYRCSGLTSVSIPNSVTTIGYMAFADCSSLQYVKAEWPSPEDIVLGSDIFNGVDTQNCALFVPDGTMDLYAVTEPWSGFVIKEGEPAISEMLPEDVYARIEGIYTCNGDGETFNLGISIYPEDNENYLKKAIIYGWEGYEWAQIECDFSFNAFSGMPNLIIPVGTPVALNVEFSEVGACNVYVLECSSDGLSLSGTINVAGNEDVSVFTFQNGIAGGLFNGSATYSSYMGYVWFLYQTLTMSKQLGSIDEVNAPDTDDITITTNGGELQIHNTLSGEPVALYTLMGQMLYSGVTTDAVTTVPVNLSKGTICILKVGANTRKVVF